jgi:hypothetical protein
VRFDAAPNARFLAGNEDLGALLEAHAHSRVGRRRAQFYL